MNRFDASAILADEGATARLAQRLAPLLGPGDLVLLSGEIGSGKTHFARAVIQARLAAAGLDEDVPSPTYTLVQTYHDGTCEIWHADLYRLGDRQELVELGLDDALPEAISLIEWPDRVGHDWPGTALSLHLSQGPSAAARQADFTTASPRMADIVRRALAG